jgi:hypothetical protein
MKENDIIVKKPLEKIKVVYNDDCAIIDFLSDLQHRAVIKHLQDAMIRVPHSGCLIHNCPEDSMVVVILWNSPFGFNDGDNKLILYADNTLLGLIRYFKKLLDNTSKDTGEIYDALEDITRLLYWRWGEEEDNDTQLNFMG